jgi:hypothetical protein
MLFHNPLNQGEAQARAFCFGGEKRPEDLAQHLGWNSFSCVRHGDFNPTFFQARAAGGTILEAIPGFPPFCLDG